MRRRISCRAGVITALTLGAPDVAPMDSDRTSTGRRGTRAMNQIPRLAVCCAATGAVALAGCGGSSSSGLSKAQLAAQADAACAAFNQAAANIPFSREPVVAASSLDKLKRVRATKQQSALLALKPDSSAKPLWDRYIAAVKHVGALFDDADAKAHANDRAGLIKLEQGISSYTHQTLIPIARQLGASTCAQ
jgi:hypothetical protein